jgi:LAO/AO transport system kinase
LREPSDSRRRLTASEYVNGVLAGDRVALGRAITVLESELPADNGLAEQILESILPHSGRSHRLGITGVPGAGKSTFIDALGMHVVRDLGQSVAVLSVDPSSPASGGSILGDKTRMERLAAEDRAFIRPSPARGHLGGVTRRTRETILLCEAAGFENIFVETVGIGQSETALRSMTDFFLLLIVPGTGDELQGMKRGIMEMLDGIAVNKADAGNAGRAERARLDYSNALHLLPAGPDGWTPRVLTCSALTGENIPAVWQMIADHRVHMAATGKFDGRRKQQQLEWLDELVSTGLEDLFRGHKEVARRWPEFADAISHGETTPQAAARELLGLFQVKD